MAPSPSDAVASGAASGVAALQLANATLEKEVAQLRERLRALEAELRGRGDGGPAAAATDATTAAGDGAAAAFAAGAAAPAASTAAAAGPAASGGVADAQPSPPRAPRRHGLTRAQAERYSRHLLLPAFGVAAQERLCRGSVLIIGCGGLGSPAAMYLAAAGVGRLGLVDHDAVELSNLHRQVMHTSGRVGMHKALSGQLTCTALNPSIQVDAHVCGFTPATALPLVRQYDVVVDASDNPATRYLASDACVVAGRPLVSAAAVGTDGQLTVYNYGSDGPCYRCLFPESPAPENCSRCGEAGVLGVVPGVMGCLQALEAVKVLSGTGDVAAKRLLIFDALAGRFTSVRLRGRSPACAACGTAPAITAATLPSYDYVLFTGQPAGDGPPEDLRLLDPAIRLSPADVAELIRSGTAEAAAAGPRDGEPEAGAAACVKGGTEAEAKGSASCSGRDSGAEGGGVGSAASKQGRRGRRNQGPLLLDVRPKPQYDVVALPGVVHVPFERLEERLQEVLELCGGVGGNGGGGGDAQATTGDAAGESSSGAAGMPVPQPQPRVVVLCRRGNNSQRVAARLAALGVAGVTDMRGGYQAWAREVDPEVPLL